MGWVMQLRPQQCQFLALDLDLGCFHKILIGHIIFQAFHVLKLLVLLMRCLVACSLRMNQTQTNQVPITLVVHARSELLTLVSKCRGNTSSFTSSTCINCVEVATQSKFTTNNSNNSFSKKELPWRDRNPDPLLRGGSNPKQVHNKQFQQLLFEKKSCLAGTGTQTLSLLGRVVNKLSYLSSSAETLKSKSITTQFNTRQRNYSLDCARA